MEADDTRRFLKKIKAYYNNFNIEDFDIIEEWVKTLKPYDEEDVLKKFQEHLNSEYGNSIPKLHFLTKYLLTKKQKEQNINCFEFLRCNICGSKINRQDFKIHVERCNSVEYLNNLSKKTTGRSLNKELLRTMDKDKFLKFYWECCNSAYNKMGDCLEKKTLENSILSHDGEPLRFEIKDLLQDF